MVFAEPEPRRRAWLRRTLTAVGGVIATVSLFMVLGAFLGSVPVISHAAVYLAPGRFVVFGLVGAGLALVASTLGSRRAGRVVVVLGLLASAGSAVILASHVLTARDHGARVDILETFLPGSIADAGAPDQTVAYSDFDGAPLLVDVYRPSEPPARLAPVVVHVHGGGWIGGTRRVASANMRWFADQGFVVMAIDYTLATAERPTWDIATPQVSCALIWAGSHAAGYGGDPERIFVIGESAGGALALTATYAAAAGEARPSCDGAVPPVRAVGVVVPAVDPVSFYENDDPFFGASARHMVSTYLGGDPRDVPDRAEAVAPATYISAGAPATIVFLAGDDHLVPRRGTEQFIALAAAAGIEIEVVRFRWADHGMNTAFHGAVNQASNQLMLQFFHDHGA